jgi:hypothetical protein
MQHAAPLPGEREAVISADRLIMGSIDRKIETVTEQKIPDGAVADKQHIARAIASQDMFDLADDAQLGIDGPFPSANAEQDLPDGQITRLSDFSVQPSREKFFASPLTQITLIILPSRSLKRGGSRSSRTLGAGCDGRKVLKRSHCADEQRLCGRRSRVVLAPRRWR